MKPSALLATKEQNRIAGSSSIPATRPTQEAGTSAAAEASHFGPRGNGMLHYTVNNQVAAERGCVAGKSGGEREALLRFSVFCWGTNVEHYNGTVRGPEASRYSWNDDDHHNNYAAEAATGGERRSILRVGERRSPSGLGESGASARWFAA